MRVALLTVLLLLPGCDAGLNLSAPTAHGGRPPGIRVLLRAASAREVVRITVPGVWAIIEEGTGRELSSGAGFDRRMNTASGKLPAGHRLVPKDGRLTVGDRTYRGELILLPRDEGIDLVLATDLEEYVPGVLAGEMGSAFPPAALRAQAVASRTYASHQMKTGERGRAWHLADDTSSQVFKGLQTNKTLLGAGRETAGLILTWAGDPLPAHFHSTCGGHTTDRRLVFGGPLLPPLTGVSCRWCTESRLYRWQADIPMDETVRKLGLPGIPTDVSVVATDPSGRAIGVRFLAGEQSVELPGHEVRKRLGWNRLRSTLILTIEIADGELRISGGGWGHAVGMCQMGAAGMARAGAGASDILAHYYPGAVIVRRY